MPLDDSLTFLHKIPVFAELLEDQLLRLSKVIIERRYPKHHIIFQEGEPGASFFFLKSGKVRLFKTTAEGKEQILAFRSPGEIFAEVVLFDGGPYPATAEVVEDAQVCLIRNRDLERIIIDHVDIAVSLLKIMSSRLRQAQTALKDIALKDVYGRLAATLLKLAAEYGTSLTGGTKITLNLTHQDLANMIGATRESVNRVMSEWRKEGILTAQRGEITILNPQLLKTRL
ncbi:MAG TPA: Crp/Fnr family transcriptional regulator [Desulfobacteria bacterium]|nr:Crp/Fnr family transcriptional regulator [Desulfobacteria bacterium]